MIIDPAVAFITRWKSSGAAELANYQLFLSELCDLIQVPRPDPTRNDNRLNLYVFERAVTLPRADGMTRTGRIDLYKRGCFILEAKQGSDQRPARLFKSPFAKAKRGIAVRGSRSWAKAMDEARQQAKAYARALPAWEGWPPFLIVVDVGHSIQLFADFSRTATHYSPFPDAESCCIPIEELTDPEIRQRLAKVWTAPYDLDPTRDSPPFPRIIAEQLASVARKEPAPGSPGGLSSLNAPAWV
jgi:hypothetical protein